MTKHDKKVKALANKYKKNGWKVKADITGFKTPTKIGKNNRIPDLEVTKNGRTRLVEVETPKSIKKDKPQQSTFRRSAAQKRLTSFRIEVTK